MGKFETASVCLGILIAGMVFASDSVARPVETLPHGFKWPVCGKITSGFGHRLDPFTGRIAFHPAIDIVNEWGTPIRASARGTVVFVGRHGPDGLMIEIEHRNRFHSRYAKLKSAAVMAGQKVRQGEVIGKLGSSGRSTGPHLHFEIMRQGRAYDPRKYLSRHPRC